MGAQSFMGRLPGAEESQPKDSQSAPGQHRAGSPKNVGACRRPTEVDAIRLAKKYRLQPWEVRDHLKELNRMDPHGRGSLTRTEFLVAVRSRFAVEDASELPEELMNDVWRSID